MKPFEEGQKVISRGNDHFGVLGVVSCEFITSTANGVPHYWRVEAVPIRQQEYISGYHAGNADGFEPYNANLFFHTSMGKMEL